jgi:hypothetical protein
MARPRKEHSSRFDPVYRKGYQNGYTAGLARKHFFMKENANLRARLEQMKALYLKTT